MGWGLFAEVGLVVVQCVGPIGVPYTDIRRDLLDL
jgi:hypothetical protein